MKSGIDTIAAIATPPGRGGVGIIRVSGPAAGAIGATLLAKLPPPRRAVLTPFLDSDGNTLDRGLVLWMPGPSSFTGEDVLELHAHGGPVVMDLILGQILASGARPARPGEFSERAFVNDCLDLVQAEAIADLIDSGSAEAARAAARSLAGELSAKVTALADAITQLRVYVEAAIDFPEEEIDFLGDSAISERLQQIMQLFAELAKSTRQGTLLRDGMTVVIAGAPNAGKSSLLNRLAGYEAAIVTDVPGTTRDVLREHIHLDGMPLHIIDTAGLRISDDPVEREGVKRARKEMAEADRVLLVIDASSRELPAEALPDNVPQIIVLNKIDLLQDEAAEAIHPGSESPVIRVSAKTGTGLDVLRKHLEESMGYQASDSGVVMARRRHLEALRRAQAHVETGAAELQQSRAGELLAEELRLAQLELAAITGAVSSDELLGEIFSSFCIGK